MERKQEDVKYSRNRVLEVPQAHFSHHNRKKNDQTKIGNLNARLEFKVDELKFAKSKLR